MTDESKSNVGELLDIDEPEEYSPLSRLSGKKLAFVREYLKLGASRGAGKDAALRAGYSPGCAKYQASRLLNHDDNVKAAIAEIRAEVSLDTVDEVKATIMEIDDHIKFCKKHKQGTAVSNLMKLKAQLKGLLVDKKDIRQLNAGLQINIGGIDE